MAVMVFGGPWVSTDVVKIAVIYGTGAIIPDEEAEWGVKEPEFGYIRNIIDSLNCI